MAKKLAPSLSAFLISIGLLLIPQQSRANDLKINLKPAALSAPQSRVTVGDVSSITGGTTQQRHRISGLDLDTLDPNVGACLITRRQVELRVLVDGWRRDQFQVVGPEQVNVRCSSAKQLRGKLEALLTKEIGRQFGLDTDTVAVRLVSHQQIKSAESALVSEDFSATVLFPAQLPIGKTRIQVEFQESNGNRFLQEFESQVIISRQVALANQAIPKGTVVDANMITVIERPIQNREHFADSKQVIGQVASRDIASNAVLLSNDVAKSSANRTPIVKRNDMLDVVVKLGTNEILLKNAKVMSAGAIGEPIVVLNTRSGVQFTATVVNRNLAEVSSSLGVRR